MDFRKYAARISGVAVALGLAGCAGGHTEMRAPAPTMQSQNDQSLFVSCIDHGAEFWARSNQPGSHYLLHGFMRLNESSLIGYTVNFVSDGRVGRNFIQDQAITGGGRIEPPFLHYSSVGNYDGPRAGGNLGGINGTVNTDALSDLTTTISVRVRNRYQFLSLNNELCKFQSGNALPVVGGQPLVVFGGRVLLRYPVFDPN